MNMHRILLLAVTLAWSLSASAQWQWIDKDGRKVFSDRPPPADVPQKNVLSQPGGFATSTPAAPPAAAASATAAALGKPKPSGLDKELEEKKKQADAAEEAKVKADEARQAMARADNCKLARQGKATMDSGIRIAQVNAKGERIIMDDAARAAENKRLQTVMSSDCK